MNFELKLLSGALASRENYIQIADTTNKDDFSDQGLIIYKEIENFYNIDPEANKVDKEILISRISEAYPKHKDLFKSMIESLDSNISIPNILKEIVSLKLSAIKFKLSAAFASQSDNKSEIESLLEEYETLSSGNVKEIEDKYKIIRAPSVEDIFACSDPKNRIQIYPLALNKILKGGVLRGHHIVFFGRPEVGKTAFLLNMCYGFLRQGLVVLYIGNEDPANDIFERFIWRLSGLGRDACKENPKMAMNIVSGRNYDKFIFCDVEDGTLEGIRGLVEEYKPDILIVDQARNLEFKQDAGKVLNMEEAAKGIRRIGKRYKLVPVTAWQAGDSAEGKLHLNMGDLDFNNTGVQGTADLMIGMGVNEQYARSGLRVISLCKNKISNQKIPVRVKLDPLRSLVE